MATGQYTASASVSGDPFSTLPGVRLHGRLEEARGLFSRVGTPEAGDLDSVYDAVTAAAVVGWRADWSALPRRSVSYVAAQEYGWIRPGHRLLLTDSDYGFAGDVAHVVSVRYMPGGLHQLGLVLL